MRDNIKDLILLCDLVNHKNSENIPKKQKDEYLKVDSLILFECGIYIIPPAIRFAKNIVEFWASSNKIQDISPLIDLVKMEWLVLTDNEITTIPDSIDNLENLEILNLSKNKIKSLPESIKNLTNLKYLYLRQNPISESEKEKIKNWLPNCEIDF